jgi:hypothetical protein
MNRNFSQRVALLVVVIIVIVVAAFIIHGKDQTPTSSTVPPTTGVTVPPTSTTSVPPAKPSAILPSQAGYPAYQHIPYSENGITVSLTNVAPDGKFDLDVYSQTLTIAQERVAYAAFLRLYNDPGAQYLPVFSTSRGTSPPTTAGS